MKTKKTFDCIEMKRHGAEHIQETIKSMTFEQKVAYWRERSRLFRQEQESLSGQDASAPNPDMPESSTIERARNRH